MEIEIINFDNTVPHIGAPVLNDPAVDVLELEAL
jgi:hypothetical protein